MPQAQQLAIQIKLEGSNQVVSAIQQVQGQFASFTQPLEAGFQLKLGAKLGDTVLRAMGAFRAAIDEGLRYAASLKDMSIQSGLTTAAIQVLGHSAEQSGASIENVRSAFTNLRQAATAAQAGNAELANAFARLGVDAQKITTLPLADQLEAIARGFAASGGDGQAFAALIRVLTDFAALQRGRALSSAERATSRSTTEVNSSLQRGRALSSAESLILGLAFGFVSVLQRGRALSSAESPQRLKTLVGLGQASTGPRSFERGEKSAAS